MTETNRLKEKIMETPWVWTLCRTAKTPEELRSMIKQLWTDASPVFKGLEGLDMTLVNWIMLYSMLTRNTEQLYTLHEIADFLRITRQSVYLYVRDGKLPALKIGGKWLVSQQALDDFIERREKRNAGKR